MAYGSCSLQPAASDKIVIVCVCVVCGWLHMLVKSFEMKIYFISTKTEPNTI